MFSSKFFALIGVVTSLAASVTGAPAGNAVDKRLDTPNTLTFAYFCANVGFAGDCAYGNGLEIDLGNCVDVPVEFNDRISAFKPLGLVVPATCTLYTDVGCTGNSYVVPGPNGVADLNAVGFADVTSSYKCEVLGDILGGIDL